MKALLLIITAAIFILGGCQSAVTKKTDSGVPDVPTDIEKVSPVEAQAAVSKAYSQFVDVRTPEEYSSGHAARAVNIPIEELSRRLRELPKGKEVIAYCRGPFCLMSFDAIQMLRKKGFQARRLRDGMPEWRAAGLNVET